ncbi:MAG TPA: FmdE family protein [Burkholderiaceae bacterium]|nr:FmdE family protein [Burkholderiaceae bacterium]
MNHPGFFDTAPTIRLQDPLSRLLGAASEGIIDYSYTDIVKLAGHSCPTVAGAYLMTRRALKQLYGDELPQRGSIKVQFRDDQLNGVTGVIANIVSFITGATADNGFKGLGGQYDRRKLLSFNAPIDGEIQFQRIDTGRSVAVNFHAQVVPGSPEAMPTLKKILEGQASDEQQRIFAQDWQDRVRRILENADHPELVTCS